MKTILHPFHIAVITIALTAAATRAHADKQAEELFQAGKKAMAAKTFATACKAFEESQRIEPLIGTQMNVALCYEQWGKLSRAHRAFRKAQRLAESAKDTRAPKIGERAEAIEPRVSLLTIRIPDNVKASDLTVSVDDLGLTTDMLAGPIAFEPGRHTLSYQLGSQSAVKVVLMFSAGQTYTETVDGSARKKTTQSTSDDSDEQTDDGDQAEDAEGAGPTESTPRTGRTQRIAGGSLVAVGGIAMGVSGYLAYAAKKDYKNAIRDNCAGSKDTCDTTGLAVTKQARKDANIGTVVFSAGLATAVAGGIVYLIAPSAHAKMEEHAIFVAPQASADGASLVVGGTF